MLECIINKIYSNTRPIIFLLNVLFILLTETLIYFLSGDYAEYIYGITEKLASINILYVKIFQAFAYNNTLIDEKMNNILIKYTDNAPWDVSDINLQKLVEMSYKYNIYLPYNYETPINAGMIALVFKAFNMNNNNETVIIKMKRKNIQKKLDDAINNLLFMVYILSFIPLFDSYKLADVIYKNIDIIRHQTNFMEEVDNMDKMRENCKNLKYVEIPTAIREITEQYPDIIVMNYIHGKKFHQLEKKDYYGFAKVIVKFGIVTTIIHGLTHGDLHGGNIIFIRDETNPKYPYRIGVIDYGIVYKVDEHYKGVLFDVFTQMFEKTPRESAEKILNSGIVEPKNIRDLLSTNDYNNIIDIFEEIIRETIYETKKANQLQIYKFLSKIKEYLCKEEIKNIGIRPSDNFVKSQLVLAMTHGVTLTLCNDDFIPLMDTVINELFNTSLLLNN